MHDISRRSRTIHGELDSMISATALAWDLMVITCDERSFPRVPGLRVTLLKS